jgi:membrane protein implicated in regulation of membrane protease activity
MMGTVSIWIGLPLVALGFLVAVFAFAALLVVAIVYVLEPWSDRIERRHSRRCG